MSVPLYTCHNTKMPCRYLVTFSPHAATKQTLGDPGEPQAVIIWDVLTGQRKRSFHAGIWPILRWSYDDQYFARCSQDMLSVYETPVSRLFFSVISMSAFDSCLHAFVSSYSHLVCLTRKVWSCQASRTFLGPLLTTSLLIGWQRRRTSQLEWPFLKFQGTIHNHQIRTSPLLHT